ncbi:hypothetical protein OHB35_51755 [Streptomyces phaeochromogenes]|uniref:Uncharacterized protein n=1 Tax=Streptomyces phaeochromogenes TaxID=1923 RepID=A0ABZ1HR21_STRPH|nr:hypothetical protein [Streptomyces phaeochromogenes]WSD21046.1 hypothetical protein OHB35_51755 [Streptomyces phaeochromogenes]
MNIKPPVDDSRNAADATAATVVLIYEDGMLRVLVRDDGRVGTQMPQPPVAADPASSASPNASPSSAANCTQPAPGHRLGGYGPAPHYGDGREVTRPLRQPALKV